MNSAALRWRFDGDRIESKSRSLMKSTSIRSYTHREREERMQLVDWFATTTTMRARWEHWANWLLVSFLHLFLVIFDLIWLFLSFFIRKRTRELSWFFLLCDRRLNGLLSGLLNVSGDWDIQYSTTTDFTPWDTPFFVSQWQLIHQIIKKKRIANIIE
jgi:hypothetical protein